MKERLFYHEPEERLRNYSATAESLGYLATGRSTEIAPRVQLSDELERMIAALEAKLPLINAWIARMSVPTIEIDMTKRFDPHEALLELPTLDQQAPLSDDYSYAEPTEVF